MMIEGILMVILVIVVIVLSTLVGMTYQQNIDMDDRDELSDFEKKLDDFIAKLNGTIEW